MGSYAAKDAIIVAKAFIKDLPIDVDFAGNAGVPRTRIMNDALEFVWNYAPWRFAVGLATITELQNDTATIPVGGATAFKIPVGAWLLNGTSEVIAELSIASLLPVQTLFKGSPRRIAYDGSNANFFPCPTGYTTPPSVLIAYSKVPVVITTANESTASAFPIPDEWYFVYQAAVLYFAYLYADDARAGAMTSAEGAPPQASGQLGTVLGLLELMKRREIFQLDLHGGELNQ